MDAVAGMIPSSPSAETSPSSSDIDTESTGSFFRDRSTTLGTLMGVSFADGEEGHQARGEAGEERERPLAPALEEEGCRWRRRWRRRRRWRSSGGSWWRLCRDDVGGSTSLGQFLDMERQLSGGGLLCGDDGEEREATAPLFDGMMLPSSSSLAAAVGEERGKWNLRRSAQGSSLLARLPVLLTSICSAGACPNVSAGEPASFVLCSALLIFPF